MSDKISRLILVTIIALMVVAGIALYPSLPAQMATHWNAAGQVNGYMSKFWGTFLLPLISAGIALLYLALPKIDPRRKNFVEFRQIYNAFFIAIMFFMAYVYALSLAYNNGHTFDFSRALLPALGFLFVFIGQMLPHVQSNWFVGIRTPWTLSSETVWAKTHQQGRWVFTAAGILALFGVFWPTHAFVFIILPLLLGVVWLTIYSYLAFRQEK